MCGIFGGTLISSDIASKAINLIHRGDDGITVEKLDENIFFAARRHLVKKSGKNESDKLTSDQPYKSEDNKISLIFNGEFYNFKNIKDQLIEKKVLFKTEGDTEVFLKLYESEGVNFLNNRLIDSMFSIAIFDKKREKILIARDWPGRIPLYYYHKDDCFIFSSELKGFKAISNLSLKEPVELEPGHYVEFCLKSNTIETKKFFSPKNNLIKKDNTILKIGEKFNELLDESSKNRTMGDVPICTMLSGGIDSYLTTYYVFKNLKKINPNFEPVSYVYGVKGKSIVDVEKARLASEGFSEIGHRLVEVIGEPEDLVNDVPGIAYSFEMRKLKALSFYPLPIYWYLAPRMKKDGFKVTIGGHGVDELLGAYDSWKELDKPHEVQIRSASRMFFINGIYNNMLKRASIIFMNRGPIEARFPFLQPNVCEYLLSIDSKWLKLTKHNAEILLDLIEKSDSKEKLQQLYDSLTLYLNNENDYYKNTPNEIKKDIEKIFWKFPLLVSSFYESKKSFLKFHLAFRPKLRGQHGAGITSLESDIINKYAKYGNSDKEIFLNLSNELFK